MDFYYGMMIDLVDINFNILLLSKLTSNTVPSEAPQNLRSTKVTTNSVTLKWEAPPLPSQNGDIIGYTIQVLREDNVTSFILSTGESIVMVTNLDDDTSYNFSVAAKTSIGAGPYSIHVTAKTKNYGKNLVTQSCKFMSIASLIRTALEVTMYSLIGGCLLLVLLAITGSCVVYCCCRSKLKQCTSKW